MDSDRPASVSRVNLIAADSSERASACGQSGNMDNAPRFFSDLIQNLSSEIQNTPAKAESTVSGQSYILANRPASKVDLSAQQILSRAEDEAERIIAEARQQAAMNLQQNKHRVLAEKQAGYQEGFREAQVAAQVMYEQQLTQLQKSFREIATELSCKTEQLLNGMEEELLDLSLDIARKVIGLELSRKNKSYRAFLRKALDKLKKQEKATVYLNDREYRLFVASQPEMFSDESGSIQFVGDDKLAPGSCQIETARGRFDASADVQIERIGKAMKG